MAEDNVKTCILGVDPGYGRIGWGVIEGEKNCWRHAAHGCIETSSKEPFFDRLLELQKELKSIIHKYRPTRAAVEDLYFAKNVKTAMKVGQARGVILLTLHEAGLAVQELSPLQVKQAISGYGRAEKRQVEKLVALELGLKEKIRPDDAADALAIALTAGFLRRH
ncbi:MAG: crossover junction endodeoxyribonuclease RuvC [Omnitrophica bacterium RIFCSPLOWO2_01_FULL_50_24]|nr:MAG: crossover junction endodeoxyribonuclease RuvC [Omnitrophica bacterium RIFCSPLOWO2_01_FULL_50_24]